MHSKGPNGLSKIMKKGKLFVSQGHYDDISVHSNGTIARIYTNESE